MLQWLGTLAGSILGGGATGILGVAVQRIADYKNKQLDLELSQQKFTHEEVMMKAQAEVMAQEWAARTKIAETEAAGAEAVADSQAFAASFNESKPYAQAGLNPAQTWLMVILDFVRGMVRPSLTVYLVAVVTLIYAQVKPLAEHITPQEALSLLNMIVGTVMYLATTCVLWWFGTRNKGAPPKGTA
jgi:hypothetical protein